jgi:hypothetical protein
MKNIVAILGKLRPGILPEHSRSARINEGDEMQICLHYLQNIEAEYLSDTLEKSVLFYACLHCRYE